ncbi:MAG: acetate--CoA ligase [Verrucomicrobiota bacterium]
MSELESHMHENRVFEPSEAFSSKARIKSLEAYKTMYQRSIDDPEGFWGDMAEENLEWFKKWDTVLDADWDSIGQREGAYVKWFDGGKINICYNCVDRHVLAGNGERIAIHWQGEDPADTRTLTYAELQDAVCRMANVLKANGVVKGTTVTMYMPMVPELAIALLACARIGAIHSVVFSAFSPDALANRMNDCDGEVLFTANDSYHGGKSINLKEKADEAVAQCPSIKRVIVYRNGKLDVDMVEGRDLWWQEACADASPDCPPEEMDAEDPLFILYTSGSTGKPKGVLHTTAGYLLYTHLTCKYVFDIQEDDVFWCTADIGWITGHSYLVYGPLSMGATQVMFEGVPTYPTPDRFWSISDRYKVTIFYTAPTALRALMRFGDEWPNKHDLSSIRILGTVGEPINPEAWMWYHRVIGKENCPIIDTWWQTETGGHMLLTIPGAHATKPGSAGMPFFGIVPKILRSDGTEADVNEGGSLVIARPWPGMIRGVYGDPKNELIHKVYFTTFPGHYFSGDGCRIDEDGYYWLLGRMDDVINVSAHRFATAEFESALVAHDDVAEAAVVGYPHETKGQGVYCYVTLKEGIEGSEELRAALIQRVRKDIGPIAKPDKIHFTPALPKTRSGKIMRRVLRKIAEGDISSIGDTSTLADPSVVDALLEGRQ